MAQTFTVQDFFKRFPDDDTCLDHLMQVRHGHTLDCPKCSKRGKFTRIRNQPAYQCAWCGHHIHPMVGTPFQQSRTSLQKWFYAMYLFTTSRHGVSAKELQRQLGVTYKCAWRMGHEIRKYLGDLNNDGPLSGHVEIDETFVGGKQSFKRRHSGKTIVLGMLQRSGGVVTKVVPNTSISTLFPHITDTVTKGSRISTDGNSVYRNLSSMGFVHRSVNHRQGEYRSGVYHTANIEGYWSQIKRMIKGTHIHISAKHLPKYLDEAAYRYNMRKQPEIMFARLLLSF